MNDLLDLLKKATKAGWRTSEFWLSIAGLGAIAFGPQLDAGANHAADQLSRYGAGGAIAGGAIIGAYSVARGMVKAAATKAIADSSSSSSASSLPPAPAPIAAAPLPPAAPDDRSPRP